MEAVERIQQRRSAPGIKIFKITALGLAVGLACWPLNAIDRIQDHLIHRLPGFSGGPWSPMATMLALAPLLVLPIILVLQLLDGPRRPPPAPPPPPLGRC